MHADLAVKTPETLDTDALPAIADENWRGCRTLITDTYLR